MWPLWSGPSGSIVPTLTNSFSSDVDINEKVWETIELSATPEPAVKRVEAHLGRLALGMADWFKGEARACPT